MTSPFCWWWPQCTDGVAAWTTRGPVRRREQWWRGALGRGLPGRLPRLGLAVGVLLAGGGAAGPATLPGGGVVGTLRRCRALVQGAPVGAVVAGQLDGAVLGDAHPALGVHLGRRAPRQP